MIVFCYETKECMNIFPSSSWFKIIIQTCAQWNVSLSPLISALSSEVNTVNLLTKDGPLWNSYLQIKTSKYWQFHMVQSITLRLYFKTLLWIYEYCCVFFYYFICTSINVFNWRSLWLPQFLFLKCYILWFLCHSISCITMAVGSQPLIIRMILHSVKTWIALS